MSRVEESRLAPPPNGRPEQMTAVASQTDEQRGESADTPAWDLVIQPIQGWAPLQLGELWANRELLYFLVWRNIKLRYKQTALGAAWAILQPLLTMVAFSLFFRRLAGLEAGSAPYPLFVFAALVPWSYFANAVSQASSSLVDNERMLTKVYFPRLLLPLAAVASGLLDLAITLVLLAVMLLAYGMPLALTVLTLPLFILMAVVAAMGLGIWLAAVNVHYRDVRYAIPFLVQFWLFVTPIAYPSSLVPEQWRLLYSLNPMVGVVEGFRWALLGQAGLQWDRLAVSLAAALLLTLAGLYRFRRTEEIFADVI